MTQDTLESWARSYAKRTGGPSGSARKRKHSLRRIPPEKTPKRSATRAARFLEKPVGHVPMTDKERAQKVRGKPNAKVTNHGRKRRKRDNEIRACGTWRCLAVGGKKNEKMHKATKNVNADVHLWCCSMQLNTTQHSTEYETIQLKNYPAYYSILLNTFQHAEYDAMLLVLLKKSTHPYRNEMSTHYYPLYFNTTYSTQDFVRIQK